MEFPSLFIDNINEYGLVTLGFSHEFLVPPNYVNLINTEVIDIRLLHYFNLYDPVVMMPNWKPFKMTEEYL